MAEDNARRSMSIIPYSTNREIVLRHNDAIVVYDNASKQLVLRNVGQNGNLELSDCPYCHRPLRGSSHERGREPRASSPGVQAGFVNPEYFRMLHHSLPSSAEPSAPPSPRRRLAQPVRSGTASPARPPPNAEFVGSDPSPPNATHGISSSAFSPNYFEKFFVEEGELGRGGRGVVLLVKHMLDGVFLGHFACKRLPIGDDHEWLEKVLMEVQVLQHLSHENLVSYRHVWLEDVKLSNFGPSVPCAFILQQYCNGGDLHNYICGAAQTSTTTQQLKERIRRRSKGQSDLPHHSHEPRKLHFEEVYPLFKDITSGLRFLHAHGYVHRDLKPSNCLLHDNGQELRVLVSDFGEVQAENAVRKSTGATGTISYCAPEVLQRVSPGGAYGNFTFKSDVFSLGMILYFLCFAQLPYSNADVLHEEKEDLDHLRAEITQWAGFDDERRVRPDLPEKLYTFLKRLLSVQPDHRPTSDEVLEGIRTGAGLPNARAGAHRKTSPSFEELRASQRIIPVESPAPSTPLAKSPTRSTSHAHSTALPRSNGTKLRRLSFSRESRSPSIPNIVEPEDVEDDDPPRSPDRDLILRPRFSSPPPRPVQQLLLPPEPSTTGLARLQALARHFRSAQALRTVVLLGKILSLVQPCSPLNANPKILYPLLLLAVVDFSIWNTPFNTLASGTHLLAILLGWTLGTLCVAQAGVPVLIEDSSFS